MIAPPSARRLTVGAVLCGAALSVAAAPVAEPPAAVITPCAAGEEREFQLDPGTAREFEVPATKREEVSVRIASDFPHRATLTGPGDQGVCSSGEGLRSQLHHHGSGGVVRCRVESSQAAAGGSFTIRIEVARARTEASAIQAPQTVNGHLGTGDRRSLGGEFVDRHCLRGRAGQPVRITVTARRFDAYLTLRFPSGGEIDDDDSAGNSDAAITAVLPEDGLYQIEVTSVGAGRGDYTLRIE